MLNLASHDQRDPDLSRNHRVLDELLDLVVSTDVSTERAAFTTDGLVGESGRPRFPVTEEITGSNPVQTAE